MKRLYYFVFVLTLLINYGCKKENATAPNTTGGITNSSNDAVILSLYQKSSFSSTGKPAYTLVVSGKNFSKNFKDQKVLFNDIAASGFAGDSISFQVAIPDAAVASSSTLTVVVNGKSKVYSQPFTVEKIQPTVTKVTTEKLMRGTQLVITGTNFSPNVNENTVTLNGLKVTLDSVSSGDQFNNTRGATPFGDTYLTVLKDFYAGLKLYVTIPEAASTGKLQVNSYGNQVSYPYDIQILPSPVKTINSAALRSISLDAAGNIYGIAKYNTIVKVTPDGTASTLATIGDPDFILGDCVADAAGNVYVASGDDYSATWGKTSQLYKYTPNSSKIFKVTPGGMVSVFAGSDLGRADGQGTAAKFTAPTHIARNSKTGDLYVTDAFVIRKITPNGEVSTFAGNNNSNNTHFNYDFKDGQGVQASFRATYAMTVDSDTGDLYVIDSPSGNELRKVTATGLVSTLSYTLAEPPGSRFVMTMPSANTTGMAVDANHNIYLSTGNNELVIINNGVVANTYLTPYGMGLMSFAISNSGLLYLSGVKTLYIVKP